MAAVRGLAGTLTDHDLLSNEALAAPMDAGPGDPQRPAATQTCGEFASQRAAALHVECLVDRLVRDPHRLIIGKSTFSRAEICSGLHALTHLRS